MLGAKWWGAIRWRTLRTGRAGPTSRPPASAALLHFCMAGMASVASVVAHDAVGTRREGSQEGRCRAGGEMGGGVLSPGGALELARAREAQKRGFEVRARSLELGRLSQESPFLICA